MIYGAAFLFDPATEAEVRRLWQSIVDDGMPSILPGLDYPPHLTIALAETLDVPALRAALEGWKVEQAPLLVHFAALGVFLGEGEGVIALEPVVNRDLLALHERAYGLLQAFATGIPEFYTPGAWVPHVTVGFRVPPAQIGRQVELLRKSTPPRSGFITGILFGGFQIEGGSVLESLRWNRL